jgi:hypothetical protein
MGSNGLAEEHVYWLKKLLKRRPRGGYLFDQLRMPDAILDTLVEKGLVRWWRAGAMEITLDGIREVAKRNHSAIDSLAANPGTHARDDFA